MKLTTPSAVRTRVVGNSLAGDGGAFDIVERLDQVVDAEGNRRDQNHTEKFEAGEHVAQSRNRHAEAEVGDGIGKAFETHSP